MSTVAISAARLVRIEARRTPAWLLLPVLAGLTWLASPYGRTLRAPVVLWSARSVAVQGCLQVIGPFAAGIAAWVAAREHRRRMTDLIVSTPRTAAARRLGTLAASTAVSLVFYAGATTVMFTVTAGRATADGPLWSPVIVGAVGVIALSAFGFALGVLMPSRFTAPLVAIGLLLGLQLTLAARAAGSVYALASPVVNGVNPEAVPFYGADTGIATVQLLLLAGVILAATATLSQVHASVGSATRWVGAVATLTGVALAGTAFLIARTAVPEPERGIVIPALVAAPVAVSFTPVCDTSGPLPVCAHPALRTALPAVADDLNAITAQFAGLPGAPTSLDIGIPSTGLPGTDRIVLHISSLNSQGPMTDAQIRFSLRFSAVSALVTATRYGDLKDTSLTPARYAVAVAMMEVAGEPPPTRPSTPGRQQSLAAAHRFAALPPSARRAWLAAHLSALQAGTTTIEQLP